MINLESVFKTFKPRSIAFWGSYGMGLNDRFTHDVDIVVYVDRLPPQRIRNQVFTSLSDRSLKTIQFPFEADFFVHKRKFYEITFKACFEMASCVRGLLKGKTSAEDEVAMFLHYTKPLLDDGWMATQKQLIKQYPETLLKSNLFLHLFTALRNVHYFERAIHKRKQALWAEFCINEGLESLTHSVFAANKTYYPKRKWAEVELRKLRHKPKGFDQSLIAIMHNRDFKAYKRLVLNVCKFCESRYPNECSKVMEIDSKLAHVDEIIELNN